MKRWIAEPRQRSGLDNASDPVCDLIRGDQEQQAKVAHFQKLVDDGISSGISDMTMDDLRRVARTCSED